MEAIFYRALKTFLQAFAGSLLVTAGGIIDIPTLKAAAIGAVAAGLSALMNLYLRPDTH